MKNWKKNLFVLSCIILSASLGPLFANAGGRSTGTGNIGSNNMPDPYVPVDGIMNVTGGVLATGVVEAQDVIKSNTWRGRTDGTTLTVEDANGNDFATFTDDGTTGSIDVTGKINGVETDYLAADFTATDTTPLDVTGISFAMEEDDVYAVSCVGRAFTALQASGVQVGLDVPASSSIVLVAGTFMGGNSARNCGTATDDGACPIADSHQSSPGAPFYIEATVSVSSTAGDTKLRLRSETTDDVTLAAGFKCEAKKIVDN